MPGPISAALPPIVSAAGLLLAVIAPWIFGDVAPAWQAGGLALAMLVLVAIVTTLMASPIFEAAYGRRVASG